MKDWAELEVCLGGQSGLRRRAVAVAVAATEGELQSAGVVQGGLPKTVVVVEGQTVVGQTVAGGQTAVEEQTAGAWLVVAGKIVVVAAAGTVVAVVVQLAEEEGHQRKR